LISVGIPFSKISHVLLTHAHYDHVFGVNKIRNLTNAVVCAGDEDCKVLSEADEDALFSLFPRQAYTGGKIQIDRGLKDGDLLDFGDASIEVIACPGHTPGSVCYLLTKDEQRILFSGDVIASLNFGPATYPVHISPSYRGDAGDYLKTINRLLKMAPPDLLLTGHPRQQTRLQSIRMSDQSWQKLLEPARIELEEVVRQHRDDGADFLDVIPKKITENLFYLGTLDGIAVYVIEDGTSIVSINAPGGDRFATFFTAQRLALGLVPMEPTIVLLTSSAEDYRSGLASLQDAPVVVASERALDTLATAGIDRVQSEASLAGLFTFAIESIALPLPPDESLGYIFSVGTKQVLVTPAVPRNISIAWTNRHSGKATISPLQPQTSALAEALQASVTFGNGYEQSVRQLQHLSPDIWLPAVPLSGQNANLYGDRWKIIGDSNLTLAQAVQKTK
jgi:glyoxylase-like metal-dependent hydrolase (beta-lactamase superfamily II)